MRRSGYNVLYNGDIIPLRDLCQQLNLNYSTMYWRVVYENWDINKAVSTKTSSFKTQAYKYIKKPNPHVEELTEERINEGVESWQFHHKKYFTKGYRMRQYRILNLYYKMFKNETILKVA